MSNFSKSPLMWVVAFLVLMFMYQLVDGQLQQAQRTNIPFSDFIHRVESGSVRDVKLTKTHDGVQITGHSTDGGQFSTLALESSHVMDKLSKHEVRVQVVSASSEGGLFSLLTYLFPFILLFALVYFMYRQMNGASGGRGGAMGFGKSRAKLLNEHTERKTFEDVAGVDEAKDELVEIVDFLKDPQKFQKLGGKIPKGCLLVGPPGTGKTLLARAIAGEAGVPFFTISGSDFVEMFVGVGASRVRDMFEQGKKSAPCIIFIDEIDAVGRHRGMGMGGGNDEREQTLNQLLVEMDGFEANEGVILIAATNRPDVLDPALLRPGRFDRQIVVANPDVAGRTKILEVHMQKVPTAPDVDAKIIARGTPGFSGADLANLVNEAALLAARRNKKVVTMREMEEAKDKVMMGVERKSMVMSEDEKKLTAYHEAGHAIVALELPDSDPIHKATIIPRGQALGMVVRLPEEDKLSYHRSKMHANLAIAMGGRVAEELIFGHDKVTSGASSDISYATNTARAMVMRWGMSDALGPVNYAEENNSYLGSSYGKSGAISDKTAADIDEEVRRIVQDSHTEATRILQEKNDKLHMLAQALLEYETLSGDEIKKILLGEKLSRNATDSAPTSSARKSIFPGVDVPETNNADTTEE